MPSAQRRLTFLLVEKDKAGLSPHKLLIEAAKHNVITAFSLEAALGTFRRFSNVDGVGIDARFGDEQCAQLARKIKQADGGIKVVGFMSPSDKACTWADYRIEPHNPQSLLDTLVEMGASTSTA